jgi:hypothetical protein
MQWDEVVHTASDMAVRIDCEAHYSTCAHRARLMVTI